ncbi:MAG TPA: HlyD family efflux transporter periplasmic adaptor subunit, partial [Gemmataceae bacterium]|nr:HlyD family efflux transporter periplasmic adaptor subunit [Gemmataceae bacterium]
MTRRLALLSTAVAACLAFTGCDKKTVSGKPEDPNLTDKPVGTLLYTGTYPQAKIGDRPADPVIVPLATVVVRDKSEVTATVDGRIAFVGSPVAGAEARRLNVNEVWYTPRDEKNVDKQWYRRLIPGRWVKAGDPIAFLDDDQAWIEYQGALIKAEGAKTAAVQYEETTKKLKQIVEKTAEGVRRGIVPEQELLNAEATYARYLAELSERQAAAKTAEYEAMVRKALLDKHTVKAPITGEVQQVLKHKGDGVKAQEPILVLHTFDNLRVVGSLPKEYASIVRPGDPLDIEVPRHLPHGTTFDLHTTNRAITAVAVTAVGGQPVVVSASEDGGVYAWDRDLKKVTEWRQLSAVRALAVTRQGVDPAKMLVGLENGTARIYDLTRAEEKPLELEGRHDGGVTAAAFAPDGKYCVTADERGIYLYTTGDGKRKYAFPKEHNSAITALYFTPQGRVLSVGREPWVRVWQVGDQNAQVEHRLDARSGDVTSPGVTDDGARLLLDADKTQLDVIHLQDARKERPLVTAGEAARFLTFSAWSPKLDKSENRMIATTGGAEGVVQLWRAPTDQVRGAEVARLITRGGAAATCAAFSPEGANGFVVVGTKKGAVHLWPLPTAEVKDKVPATVTHVENLIDTAGRSVGVVVDFENPKLGETGYLLRPGAAV